MHASEPSLIELRGVGRVYHRKGVTGRSGGVATRALSDVSLRIDAGEFVCVMGPSGSGKSTLMNILGCLDRPTEGSYRFRGRDVGRLSPDELARLRRESFGFVFQSYNLLRSATARENVELPAGYAGIGRTSRAERAEALLNAFGLGRRFSHRPSALSGGEQQRVAIARALMNGGQVILADEPTGALDTKNSDEVLDVLTDLAERGHTVIVITHDPEVASWAKRRIELLDGRVVADATVEGARARGKHSSTIGRTDGVIPAQSGAAKPSALGFKAVAEALVGGLASLRANLLRASRLRTMLTVLSVTVGVWSVVAMLSVVQGGYREGLQMLSQAGANRIAVLPSGQLLSKVARLAELTLDDVQAIAEEVDGVRGVLPTLGSPQMLRRGDLQLEEDVEAVAADMLTVHEWTLESGTFFSERDSEAFEPVVVIGLAIREMFFRREANPVGEYLLIGEKPFLVKGVLSRFGKEGNIFIDSRNSQVLVPMGTGQALLFGGTSLDSIMVFAEDPKGLGATMRAVKDVLARRHVGRSFVVQGDIETRIGFTGMERILSALIGAVGAISLFVGGMGVTSVMLVSVSERTREIGIRMATGARYRDILRQFLLEAVAITVAGGTLGTVLGFASSVVLSFFDMPAGFSAWFVIAALGCATGTGLIAGMAPARKAARLDPVAALAAQ